MRKTRTSKGDPQVEPAKLLPDFSHLPERIAPEEMTTTQPVEDARDPRGGRDTETEFMLRNAGGF